MEIRVRLGNQEKVLRSLGRLNRLLSTEGKKPQEIVLEEVLAQIHRAFDQQSSPQGVPWPPTRKGRPALRGLRDSFYGSIGRSSVTVRSTRPTEVAAHDAGVEITAKGKGGLLAIPFEGMRPPKGMTYRDAYPGAFVLPTQRIDRYFLVRRENGNLTFIATLVYAVKMPKRGIWPTELPRSVIERLTHSTQSIWEGF